MMSKVLVAFALKDEFAPWRRRHRFRPIADSPFPVFTASFGSTDVYAALAGAGAPDAHHFNDLISQFTPSLGIVTGVAAGLKPEWRPGDLLVAQSVSGPDGNAPIPAAPNLIDLAVQCGAKPAPVLITLPHIARTVAEKARLASIGDAVDMESLPLMRQWSSRGIPSLALRVILDPAEMPMTCDFEAAMDAHGQVRITRIMAQLIRRPQLLPDFLRLARQSHRVLLILARFLDRFFEGLDRQSPNSNF
jgi:adenosylhomocysteine nucleosidase